MRFWLAGLAFAGAWGAAAFQEPAKIPNSVRATAEATVMARPDRARLHIGVVTQAAGAQQAAEGNARQLEAVLAALRKALGPAAAIQTAGYSLNPNYRYPREGGQPTITGYTASNTVQVTLDDLALTARAIDTATQFGANAVQSLQFMLKDERPARAQALREATQMARFNAEAMAAAAGLRVVRVLSIEQGQAGNARPVMREMAMAAAAGAPATPVEAGSIEVRAVVVMTVAVE